MSKLGRWLIILSMLALIVLLFRVGANIPAGVMSFILFLTALAERVMRLRMAHRHYKQTGESGEGRASSNGRMTRDEALEVLGLKEGANTTEIKKAYKTLMAKIHPDQGGSGYLAAKLNEAKDVLLKK